MSCNLHQAQTCSGIIVAVHGIPLAPNAQSIVEYKDTASLTDALRFETLA